MKTKSVFFKCMAIAALGCFLMAMSCHGTEEGTGTTPSGAAGAAATGAISVSSINLVRLDGTELYLPTLKPIPRAVKIKVSFNEEVTSDQRAAIEDAFKLEQGANALDKTFSWGGDGKSFVATPARWFKYGTSYNVGFDPDVFSKSYSLIIPSSTFATALKGDVNGDGYADIAVGAPGFDGDGNYRGRVYIFYGSSAGGIGSYDLSSASANVSITGTTDNDGLGGSVSITGDINADGYADIVIGAAGNLFESPGLKGKAYVFLGGPSLSSTILSSNANNTVAGEGDHDRFGKSVAIAGNVNGDGYDDVVIGAPSASVSNAGKIYVYFGSAEGISTTPSASTTGLEKTQMGWSVSGAGDTNADGYDDIIVGAAAQSGFSGYAYVFPGGASFTLEGTAKTIKGPVDSFLGGHVSTAGDVNSDGLADVIVSASAMDTQKGRAFVFFGSPDGINNCDMTSAPPCTPDLTIKGTATNGLLYYVSTAGDVNKDDFSDIILGAAGLPMSPDKGYAYVFYGTGRLLGEINTGDADVVITGRAAENMLGSLVSTAGDTNGDGIDDILVGAPGANGKKGEAYVFLGSSSGINNCDLSAVTPCTPSATIKGANVDDLLGFGCELINGDINAASAVILFLTAMLPLAFILVLRKREQ